MVALQNCPVQETGTYLVIFCVLRRLIHLISLALAGPQVTAATARTNRGLRPSLTSLTRLGLLPQHHRPHPPMVKMASTLHHLRGCTSGPSNWVSSLLKGCALLHYRAALISK